MIILLNKREDIVNVSINSDELILKNISDSDFATLNKLVNVDFPQVETMKDAKEIEAQIRSFINNVKVEEYKDHEFLQKFLTFNTQNGNYYLKNLKGDILKGFPMPQFIVHRLEASKQQGIDPTPLVKAFIRLFRNPNLKDHPELISHFEEYINYNYLDSSKYNDLLEKGYADETARSLSTFRQTPITMEGLLCTYKVSREITVKFEMDENNNITAKPRYKRSLDEDTGEVGEFEFPEFVEDRVFEPAIYPSGDKFICEDISGNKKLGYIYKVGCTHYLESWDQVDTNNNVRCRPGIHVGNLDYIKGYGGPDTATHNVFIDPSQIGAIPMEGSGDIRVKEMFIHSSKEGDNRGIYHSSKYAARKDAEWSEEVDALIDSLSDTSKEFQDEINNSKEELRKLS